MLYLHHLFFVLHCSTIVLHRSTIVLRRSTMKPRRSTKEQKAEIQQKKNDNNNFCFTTIHRKRKHTCECLSKVCKQLTYTTHLHTLTF